MKPLSALLFLLAVLASCQSEKDAIVLREDVSPYLQTDGSNKELIRCNGNIAFWESRGNGATELSKLAGLYASRFKLSGTIDDLHRSDSLLNIVNEKKEGQVGIYHAIATNAISQHQFKKAKQYIDLAVKIGDKKAASLLMLADVSLELGDTYTANRVLNDFTNKNSFAWLIRKAKVKDHEGQLDSTIHFMERALARVGGNKDLYIWTKTNLGDFYSHAGRVEEAYQCYTDILRKDPNYHYALKQIAWIAFSHDHNTTLAKEILGHLTKIENTPDHYLTLAYIATWEGATEEARQNMLTFTSVTTDERYGDMYNKYLINVYIDNKQNIDEAVRLAEREVSNRPTSQSYDLLAWANFNAGNKIEALQIAQDHVMGKTVEPDALYHMGVIYKENSLTKRGMELLNEAINSSFELGPLVTQKIQASINTDS